jgi:hypothetical protein
MTIVSTKSAMTGNPNFIEITPMHVGNPLQIKFDNFILDAFSDVATITKQEETVFGRSDPIQFYSGTKRSIKLDFTVFSRTKLEAGTNFTLLKRLTRYTYPVYQGPQFTLKSPPLMRVHFAGTFDEIGYIDSAGFVYDNPAGWDNVHYSDQMDESQIQADGGPYIVPRYFKINLAFSPIHREVKGFDESGNTIVTASAEGVFSKFPWATEPSQYKGG